MTTANRLLAKEEVGNLLTVEEVAAIRDVTLTTVYRWLTKGLRSHNRWGRKFVRREDAAAFEPEAAGKPQTITDAMIGVARKQLAKGEKLKDVAASMEVKPGSLWAALRRTKQKQARCNGRKRKKP